MNTNTLLQQIAALPNTMVQPFPHGGGFQIIEQRRNGVAMTSIWIDRKSTLERLQAYLADRQANA